jgi:serine/threonine protein kinase
MSPEELFHTALSMPVADRPAFLAEACASDSSVRRRIEELLRAHDNPGSFLADRPPLPNATIDQSFNEGPGKTIGPYKLLQQIGEGGMGTVFMAEQTHPVQRKVALKVIRAGMDSRQVIARFEAERQALAMMDHVNIARVFDGGATDAGRPYFVMELVHGVPITKYCDDNHLTPRQRLELFVPVCQAIQHAHQKGIIHRDIKPSNVMITLYDGKPVPKVIDFGVAKATEQKLTERTLFTQYGTMVGTLEYMSPEQAEMSALGVDTRSDIYSLGVLLYELLTGSTPLSHKTMKEAAYGEILRMIKEEEPPKPSTRLSDSGESLASISANRLMEPAKLTKLLRGELDWIVMKTLEKDRNRRYETAKDFAADVQRYLADEPVQACPPSAWYRFRKFARRHKGPVLAANLLFLALVIGMIGTSLGFFRAEQQRQIAEGNEHRAVAAAEAEKQASEKAHAREAETNAVLDFVEKRIIAAARPEGQAGGLGREVTLRKALEAALPDVGPTFANQPLVEARLRFTLATSFANLGDPVISTDQLEKARAIWSKHLGPDHPDTLASMHNLANCYYALGRQSDSLKLREETLALLKAKLGLDDPRTLAAMSTLAVSYATIGEKDKALKLNEETLTLQKAKLGPHHPSTLGSMNNLAGLYSGLGRHDDALKLGQETVALMKDKHGPKHRFTLTSMDTLAMIYHNRGEFGEAVKLYELTLSLMKDILGPDHNITLSCMMGLANSHSALGRYSEELKIREEILLRRQVKLAIDHPNLIESLNYLAGFLATCPDLKLRDPKRAVELAKRSVELAPRSEWSWQELGWARYRTGDWKDSITALEKSLELRKDGGDPFNWFYLAMAYWQSGDKAAARKWYDRAVEWTEKYLPKDQRLVRFRAEAADLLELKEKK